MKIKNIPAGTVAIALDGELIFAKGYGYEDIDEQVPVDPAKTLFRPGSVSKLFTWVSVMQLVEQGRLDLDTDVNTYLESVKIKDTFELPITLRHILTHTSGFEDGALGYLIVDDPDNVVPLRETMSLYAPKRVNPPGKQTAYSNYATALAGLIVENVAGLPFNDYVKQNILDPLGMMNASFAEPLPEHLDARMAKSYKPVAGAFKEQPFEIVANFGPAGALSATATDMIRFAQALLNGGELDGKRILRTDTVEQMLTRNFSHDDRLMGMLLGFYEADFNGNRVIGHGGDMQRFHSDLGFDRENNLAFFVSFGGSNGRVARSALPKALYDEFFPRENPPRTPPEDFKERAARYAGTYKFWRGNFSKIEKVFSLGSEVKVSPTEDNTLLVAFADGAKQYVEVEKNLFCERNPGLSLVTGINPRQIAFQESADRAVTGMVMVGLPFMSLRKVAAYETASFNLTLIGIALLVMLGVVLRCFFQRRELATLNGADRSAFRVPFCASAAHLAVVVFGAIVMDNLINGLPTQFRAWLVLPIIATLATLFLLWKTFEVWKQQLFPGTWARIRYAVVALSALFMSWFYWTWNILGFQYLK